MLRNIAGSLLAVVTLAAQAGAQDVAEKPAEAEKITVGSKAPDFTVTGIDGKPIKLSERLAQKKNLVICFNRAYW